MVKGSIDGRRDLCGGRKSTDEFTAAHSMAGKFFRSICYSTDGEFVIGGGQSKYICIYELRGKSLVRKYALTQNLSLEVSTVFHHNNLSILHNLWNREYKPISTVGI